MEAAAVPLWSSRRGRAAGAYLALGGSAAASVAIALGAVGRLGVLVPAAKLRYPGWLAGPLSGLGIHVSSDGLAWLLAALLACYLGVLACAGALPGRVAAGAVVALHAVFLIAPPLASSDVFGYIDAARLGALHGVNPYSPASTHLPPDAVHLYRRWATDLPSAYGPLFVLLSYALVPLGIAGGLWSFKVLTALGSLATVWLVWRCAALLGRDPRRAALFVGLNPLVLLFAVGGAHNDFFGVTLVMGAVYLALAARERLTGAALVAAAAFKLPLGLPLVFTLARPGGGRRRAVATGAALAAAVLAAISLVAFGSHAGGFLTAVRDQQHEVAIYSVPNQVGKLLGFGGITQGLRVAFDALLVATVLLAVRYVRRGGDWVTAAGWAFFALLVASAWLLPWYATWLLPLAAISADRRLRAAALALTAYIVLTRVSLWASLGR